MTDWKCKKSEDGYVVYHNDSPAYWTPHVSYATGLVDVMNAMGADNGSANKLSLLNIDGNVISFRKGL